ncbi:MAG TPA: AbrB/MazE/SpoVT family DNA-binding domain-containing protein [Rhizobiaceae bacterium]|nr:AbrB/MazE/SpoVT family DNA-binding domain-containing protein [Rhizobiaceae bacterium]
MGFEAKITSKGQATIPAEVRQRLGLQAGDRVAFIEMEHGFLLLPRNRPVESLFGSLAQYAIPGTTQDDYEEAVGEGISTHVEGGRQGGSAR